MSITMKSIKSAVFAGLWLGFMVTNAVADDKKPAVSSAAVKSTPAKAAPAPAKPASAPAKASAPTKSAGTATTTPHAGTTTGGGTTTTRTTTGGATATPRTTTGGGTTTTRTTTGGGTTTTRTTPGGGTTTTRTTPGGGSAGPGRPNIQQRPVPIGHTVTPMPGGGSRMVGPNGQFRGASRNGLEVRRPMNGGGRVFVHDRPGGVRIYGEHGRPGYYRHAYLYGGRSYYRRGYYINGGFRYTYYHPYMYNGIEIEIYSPARYYPVAYYGWAYHPWGVSVSYNWGFAGSPWYGYYGGYFAPQPAYISTSAWLADYMVAKSLQDEYAARLANNTQMQPLAQGGQPGLTPEVQAQITAEVQRQIAIATGEAQANAAGQQKQSNGIGDMMVDGISHVFVVANNLDLTNAANQGCSVSPGDVLQLIPAGPGATMAGATVLASKPGDCAKASYVNVAFADLQEMQNQMRATIDQGLQVIRDKKVAGLPQIPAAAAAEPVQVGFADPNVVQGPPEQSMAAELAAQAKEADALEAEATAQSRTAVAGTGGNLR